MSGARERIAKAISALVLMPEGAFWACMAMGWKVVESTDPKFVDTAATNGPELYFWPPYIDKLSDRQLIGLMVHEVGHVANLHHVRRGGRDPKEWNIACDYALDAPLVRAGFEVPDAFPAFAAEDMAAEAIYAARQRDKAKAAPKPEPKPGEGAPQPGAGSPAPGEGAGKAPGSPQAGGAPQPAPGEGGPGAPAAGGNPGAAGAPSRDPGSAPGTAKATGGRPGGVLDAAPDANGMEAAALETEARVKQAAAVARAAGKGVLPGAVQSILDSLAKPSRDWREELAKYVEDSSVREFTWQRPNRRFAHMGLTLPSMVSEAMPLLVIFNDVSGSVTMAEQKTVLEQGQGMLDSGRVAELAVVFVDNRVRHVDRYQLGDRLTPRTFKGGGTSFVPAFQWLEAEAPEASLVVYLTDLECNGRWGEAPPCPVIWGRVGNSSKRPPFGDAILDIDPAA